MNENNAVRKQLYEKPEKKDVMDDIIDAVMLNTEYEAGIKVHQGRELNVYEKPETREVMLKTDPKGKYKKPEEKGVMDDITDAVMLNMEHEAGVRVLSYLLQEIHRGRKLNM
jgi:hypothetical protein